MIYYGDEIGMEGENDPDCRRPMIWDASRWHQGIHDATRKLVALRHAHPALKSGELRTLRIFNGVYAYARVHENDRIIIVLNPRGAQPELSIDIGDLSSTTCWVDALSGKTFSVENGKLDFSPLPAQTVYALIPMDGHG
jgi:glycosidase